MPSNIVIRLSSYPYIEYRIQARGPYTPRCRPPLTPISKCLPTRLRPPCPSPGETFPFRKERVHREFSQGKHVLIQPPIRKSPVRKSTSKRAASAISRDPLRYNYLPSYPETLPFSLPSRPPHSPQSSTTSTLPTFFLLQLPLLVHPPGPLMASLIHHHSHSSHTSTDTHPSSSSSSHPTFKTSSSSSSIFNLPPRSPP